MTHWFRGFCAQKKRPTFFNLTLQLGSIWVSLSNLGRILIKHALPVTHTDHPVGNDVQAAYHWSSEGDVTS